MRIVIGGKHEGEKSWRISYPHQIIISYLAYLNLMCQNVKMENKIVFEQYFNQSLSQLYKP